MSVPTEAMRTAARERVREDYVADGCSDELFEQMASSQGIVTHQIDAIAVGIAYAADLIAGDIEACAARCNKRKGPRGHDDPQWVLFTMFENEYLEVAAQIRGGEFLP